MNLNKVLATQNDCYKANKSLNVKGIMVHSTGANNPNLRRYVAPDDGKLGTPSSANWNQPKPDGRQVCVHAFIGKLADGSVATYQTLPWTTRGWHAGGYANNTHIGFEICEDNLQDSKYFNAVYKEAVEFCAYLCKMFGLNPLKEGVLITHSEAYQLGWASNHADVMHWFPKHKKTMDTFRKDVSTAMKGDYDKMLEQLVKKTGKTETEVIEALSVLVKNCNLKEDGWEKEGVDALLSKGIITQPRDGNAPVSWGELGVVLNRILR